MTAAVLLLAAALTAAAAPATGPLDAKAAEWEAKGYTLKDRVEKAVDGTVLAVAAYSGADGDRLEAYVAVKGKAYLGYTHPAANERLEIDESPEGRAFRDLFRDGSRVFAYRSTIRALNASFLDFVAYKRFKFRRVAEFPEGRVVRDGDEALVLARDLPLGRFLSVGCEDFGTISRTAFRSRLYAFKKGGFKDASSAHPAFYAAEIARKEAALGRLKGDLQKNAGEYLGLTLSMYYDYAARGEARKGWERQREFFQVPAMAPASVRACFDAMRADLRGRLAVPADWP
ncbi:MAG: hypothetical protein HY079_04995 [Elusimicrobia bacterium]|nr:hypothetical protein [Elusimicrobiota bacterium]